MSGRSSDLSNALSEEDYVNDLSKTVKLIKESMLLGGLVAAVGRDYRAAGKRIRLDHWFLEIFGNHGFSITDVWTSEPDVVLIFER